MAEIILELLCEEIPQWMLKPACQHLAEKIPVLLTDLRLTEKPAEVTLWFSPRRLALRVQGLSLKQSDLDEVRTGPPMAQLKDKQGEFSRAAMGFAKKFGQNAEDLFDQNGKAALRVHHAGKSADQVLPSALTDLLMHIPWPKVMRWGSNKGPFVRPVRNLLALFGSEGNLSPLEMTLFDVNAGSTTVGHRIFSPEPFEVKSWESYQAGLAQQQVTIDPIKRQTVITDSLNKMAKQQGATLLEDQELAALVARQVECPSVLVGSFPEQFLQLPQEVVITVLREHQKFFCLADDNGKLLPKFLNVIDAPSDEDGLVVRANEGVTTSRLKDALFFWKEDLSIGLDSMAEKLEQVTYHRKLGSYADKVARIKTIALKLAKTQGAQSDAVARATHLCKADLVSLMIGEKEMTDLQGQMGGFYAREQGESEAVWRAMASHYQPVGIDDSTPTTLEGKVLALADKADTLAGMFGVGQKPTGSKDPFALRRAVLGILRIGVESGLDLGQLYKFAIEAHGTIELKVSGSVLEKALLAFTVERFGFWLQDIGFPKNEVSAVLTTENPDPAEIKARLDALHEVRQQQVEVFEALAAGAKRVRNILKDQNMAELVSSFVQEDLQVEAERSLLEKFLDSGLADKGQDHRQRLLAMASLRPLVDRFFDEVMVMCEDQKLRQARLGLLATLLTAFDRTADLSRL